MLGGLLSIPASDFVPVVLFFVNTVLSSSCVFFLWLFWYFLLCNFEFYRSVLPCLVCLAWYPVIGFLFLFFFFFLCCWYFLCLICIAWYFASLFFRAVGRVVFFFVFLYFVLMGLFFLSGSNTLFFLVCHGLQLGFFL